MLSVILSSHAMNVLGKLNKKIKRFYSFDYETVKLLQNYHFASLPYHPLAKPIILYELDLVLYSFSREKRLSH